MNTSAIRWLDKNQYQRIRRKAKAMGAESTQFKYISHTAYFRLVTVSFAFRPFQASAFVKTVDYVNGDFHDPESAEELKAEIDKALSFIEWLREFNASEVEADA